MQIFILIISTNEKPFWEVKDGYCVSIAGLDSIAQINNLLRDTSTCKMKKNIDE